MRRDCTPHRGAASAIFRLLTGDLFVPLVLYSDSAEIYPGSDDDEEHLLLYRTPEHPESG